MKRQAGFTLVEIAIVLVIIGLLLGGVLKGQELIESAKVKNIAQDMRAISVAVLTYQDKYRALPGDDKNAETRWSGAPSKCGSDGNGLIDTATEAGCVWAHLRLANLLTGDPSDSSAPKNADAGSFFVTSKASLAPVSTVTGTLIVCASAIRGRHVVPLDAVMDDGDPTKGSMIAKVSSTTAPPSTQSGVAVGEPKTSADTATPIKDGDAYDVCMGF